MFLWSTELVFLAITELEWLRENSGKDDFLPQVLLHLRILRPPAEQELEFFGENLFANRPRMHF